MREHAGLAERHAEEHAEREGDDGAAENEERGEGHAHAERSF